MNTTSDDFRARIAALLAAKAFDDACALLAQRRAAGGLDVRDVLTWSEAEKSRGDLAAAFEVLDALDGADADRSDVLIARGKIRRDQGRHDEALREYARALDANPEDDMAHCQSGIVHEIRGDWDRAAESYRAALAVRPAQGMYWMGLAKALRAQGDEAAAADAFGEAERRMADETDYNRACLFALMGRSDDALAALARFCAAHAYAGEWARQDPDLASLRVDARFELACRGDVLVA